jgi:hypothetical protein
MIHFVEISAKMYQSYSLKMTFNQLKLVGGTNIVSINWWFNDIWVYLSVFVWYGATGARVWIRRRWSCHCAQREGVWRSGGRDPFLLNLGIRWMWEAALPPRPPDTPEQWPPYPRSRKLAGRDPQSISTRLEGKKELYCPYMESNNAPWLSSPQSTHYSHWANRAFRSIALMEKNGTLCRKFCVGRGKRQDFLCNSE